jgi:hypothetical protein
MLGNSPATERLNTKAPASCAGCTQFLFILGFKFQLCSCFGPEAEKRINILRDVCRICMRRRALRRMQLCMRQSHECALGRIFNQSNQIIHVTFMAGVNKICLFDLPSHAAEEKKNSIVQDQHVQYAQSGQQTPIFLCHRCPFTMCTITKAFCFINSKTEWPQLTAYVRERYTQLILKQKV